jgi:hypothetical protein
MAAWLAVLPGVPLIGSPFGVCDLAIILVTMSVALVMLPLTIFAGLACDTCLTRWEAACRD